MGKLIIGVLLILSGIALGAYVGIWLCFIGGIIDVIEQVRAVDLSASTVAIGVAKVLFSGFAGWLSAVVLVLPGAAFINAA
jgi:hypothetical protein